MKIIWIATSGNDTTGNGSQNYPYATLERGAQDFASGDQLRILDGTYTPNDSLVISNKDGSIFAENPNEVTIQPKKTTLHQACIAVLNTNRFSISGIKVKQASDSSGNLAGIYVNDVANFVAYTCTVFSFDAPSGNAYGIFASGGGRVENCDVYDINGGSVENRIYGIKTIGVDIIDCSVNSLSGVNVTSIEYEGTYTL